MPLGKEVPQQLKEALQIRGIRKSITWLLQSLFQKVLKTARNRTTKILYFGDDINVIKRKQK